MAKFHNFQQDLIKNLEILRNIYALKKDQKNEKLERPFHTFFLKL